MGWSMKLNLTATRSIINILFVMHLSFRKYKLELMLRLMITRYMENLCDRNLIINDTFKYYCFVLKTIISLKPKLIYFMFTVRHNSRFKRIVSIKNRKKYILLDERSSI